MKTTRLLVLLIASLFCLCKSALAQEDNREAYAVLKSNTLTFYYDNERSTRNGSKFNIPWIKNNPEAKPGWYIYRDGITTVVFDDSFSNYHELSSTANMFYELTDLTTIEGIANLKTENVTDMSYMFYNCYNLESLTLSSFNTSNVTNMSNMFSGCNNLNSLNVSSFNTSNVKDMSDMFSSCYNLNSLNVSNFNTSNVTDMSKMFSYSRNLNSLNLSNFNTSNVKDMTSMFEECNNLTSLTLSPLFKTPNVERMTNMFYNCFNLGSLNLSSFETTKVEYMDCMFYDCRSLTELDLSSFYTSAIITMTGMFSGCEQLKSLDIRNFSITISDPDLSYSTASMFWGCSNLTKIICLNSFVDSNIDSGSMFYNCTKLKGSNGTVFDLEKVDGTYAHPDGGPSNPGYFTDGKPYAILSNGTLKFYYDLNKSEREGQESTGFDFPTGNNAPDWTTSEYASTIHTVTFDESFHKYTGLTSPKLLFNGLSSLTTINNLKNLNTDYVTDMSYMFSGCSGLTSLDLSELSTDNVSDMSYMFDGCKNLKSIDLSSFNTESVTDMSYMFNECSSLEKLDLSSFNTENVTDMSSMFNGCSGLTSLDLYDFHTYNVEDMSSMFNECTSLKSIYCYNDWAYGAVSNSENMFAGCSNLKGAIQYNETNDNDITYANPTNGYFSIKREAYAYIDGNSLIFCYDTHKFEKFEYYDEASVFPVKEEPEIDENSEWDYEWARWIPYSEEVTKVIFDPSFDDFRPKSTISWFSSMSMVNSFVGLEYLHTEAVTDMSGMFVGCGNLTSLDLTNFNVSIVTDMSYMFADCSSLEMIYAGDWSNINCKSEGMFAECNNLPGFIEEDSEDYDITWAKPKDDNGVGFFSTKQVYAIVEDDNLTFLYDGYYSEDTYSIDQNAGGTWRTAAFTTVTFDASFAAYKLSSTAGMFSGLTELTTINDLDNLNTSSITDMRNMFNGCTNLKTIYCGKDWSRLKVPSTGMFAGCENLPNFDPSQVTVAKAHPYDYGYFTKLPQAYAVQEGSVLTFYYDNGIDTHSDAITYEIPWFDYYPEWTGMGGDGYAPARRSAKAKTAYGPITRVVFNPSFAGYEELYYTTGMFYWMESLTSIEGLEYLNTENVIYMQDMFAGCSSLTSLNLTNFDVSSVESMYNMFYGCRNLGTIFCNEDWSETAVSLDEENGDGGMFDDCYSLKGRYGANYEDFMNDDEASSYISYARPDEADNSGFFTALLPDDILLYDSRSNTETINNSNGSVKVFLVDRTLYKTGDWNTLCLPFSLSAEQLAESPLAGYTELRTLSDAQYNAGTLTLNFTPATGEGAVTSIEAGKPYIIKWNSGENIVNPIFTNVSLANNSLKPVETDVVSFMGTYDPKPLTSANSNILYLGAGNTLYYPSANMTINSFRAYFELDLTSAQQVKAINLNFGDEENGIQEITTDSNLSNSSNTYFSLDGRRLLDKPTQKGMYINNGRKVLIK